MREVCARHADNCVRLIVKPDLLADDIWIARESLLPEAVADYRDWRCARLVVVGSEVATE
jgi:hypothetical protein